jgi:hypothetical protein
MEKTLLEKAMEAVSRQNGNGMAFDRERFDLAMAFAKKTITAKQVRAAFGDKMPRGSVSSWAGYQLLAGVRAGHLVPARVAMEDGR